MPKKSGPEPRFIFVLTFAATFPKDLGISHVGTLLARGVLAAQIAC
jgi:hypothetical protein